MIIKLESFVSTNLATGEEQVLPQYKIVVDGSVVGYKGWKFGTPCCFIGRLSPLDKSLIEDEVNGIIGDGTVGVMPLEYDPSDQDEPHVEIDDDFIN